MTASSGAPRETPMTLPPESADIQGRVKLIRRQIDETTSDYDKEKLQERLAKLADVFEKIGHRGDEPIPYLASHPSSAERIAHIRQSK